MIEGVDWDSVISAAAGGGAAVAAFKAFLSKSLREIEANTERLHQNQITTSSILTKLEALDKIIATLNDHDRKIAKLETRHEVDSKKRN